MRTYTIKQKQQAVALYEGGLSCQQVAQRLGISRGTIYGWLCDEGVTRSRKAAGAIRRARDRHPDMLRAAALYDSGMTYAEVADLTGYSVNGVWKWVKQYGTPRSRSEASGLKKRHRTRQLRADIWRLRAEGLTGATIAREVGCSLNTVYKHLREPESSVNHRYQPDQSGRNAA